MPSHESYYDSAHDSRISVARAIKEIAAHGSDPASFFQDHPPSSQGTYDAQEVLRWLGY